MRERGKSIRVRMDFMVCYQKKGNSQVKHALGVNASSTGIVMKMKEPLKKGDRLIMDILVPGRKEFIHFEGEVVYSLGALWEEEPPYRCGITFSGITKEMKQAVARFVQNSMKHQNWMEWF